MNRTLHGRLGIRVLSSRAESISHSFVSLTHERYFQHSKHHVDVPSDIVHRIRSIVAVNFRLFQNQKSYPERGIVECLFSVSVDLVRGMTAS